ncbi:MAG TPA: hypothetical protein VFC19_48855 [Candidatus Limnocylindrales bacterium]|nr:hypothetical protein [Candidatus Limnocylindrales bacterium]
MLHTRPHVASLLSWLPRLLWISIGNGVISVIVVFCAGLSNPRLSVNLILTLFVI